MPRDRSGPPVEGMDAIPDSTAQRVELILQQLEAIPTLSAVAVRVLELTSDDESQAKDVIRLVETDPALSAKVLTLCRCSERGRALNVTTVERAVLLLGFEALRSAVLSAQVFELLDGVEGPGGEVRSDHPVFDRSAFWHHSLAVATICEALAGTSGPCHELKKPDAFVAGLLHDLGVLALHLLLPRTFDRICELAEAHDVSLNQACRKIIGLDTHTAGRRLAEHWHLPHSLSDVMWLHGQRFESLPDLPHRPQIALVSLADAVARSHCIAPAGHGPRDDDMRDWCAPLGIDVAALERVVGTLHQDVAARAASLGLADQPESGALLRSLSHANVTLGRINANLRRRAMLAQKQTETLQAITRFHDSAMPGGSLVEVMGKVVSSAEAVLGGEFFAMLYQARVERPWHVIQFSSDGRPLRSQLIEPPKGSTAVGDLADEQQVSMQSLGLLPWLCDYLGDARDVRDVQLLPLRCGWGVNAVLLHDCPVDGREAREQLEALGRTWASSIAAAAQHEGAKRLGDQLAEANLTLMETQHELARSRALASVGEIAAGAAHEMNNPLTIISGRSQLLASRLNTAQERQMAEQIVEQSHRLSAMITALRQFAEPTHPDLQPVELSELLSSVVADLRGRFDTLPNIQIHLPETLTLVHVDPEQMRRAVTELLCNAVESAGCSRVDIRVQIEPGNDRLTVQVTDDGEGLSSHALAHAFDPFFSAKSAGRKPGLGLAQAQRIVEAHGGQITLENVPSGGAVATIRLDHWRGAAAKRLVA